MLLKSGLARTLLISFTLAVLLPLLIVSIVSLQHAKTELHHQAETALELNAINKATQITQYFGSMLKALKFEGESRTNLTLLTTLTLARDNDNKNVSAFVHSPDHKRIIGEKAGDLKRFRNSFYFHDVFLIASNGDILYSVSEEEDLGTNLINGPYKLTRFAAAFQKSIETGKTTFSDYEHYEPSSGLIYGFLCVPVMDHYGTQRGVLAAQFPIDLINTLLRPDSHQTNTLISYLVGPDLSLRSMSNKEQDHEQDLLAHQILTPQTALFKKHIKRLRYSDKNEKHETKHNAFLYKGPSGRKVLGTHHMVTIENIVFAIITEVDAEVAFATEKELLRKVSFLAVIIFFAAFLLVLPIILRIVKPLIRLTRQTEMVAHGDYSSVPELHIKNEIGALSRSFNEMTDVLRENKQHQELNSWFKDGQVSLGDIMRVENDITEFCRQTITFISKYLDAAIGAMYLVEGKHLKLVGSYAFTRRKNFSDHFEIGHGIVGQAALERQPILLTSVPDDYITIQSGLGNSAPRSILVFPIVIENEVLAVIEIGSLDFLSDQNLDFIKLVSENIGISIQTLQSNIKMQALLEESQTQTEELAAREEELSQANKGLEKQTAALKASESSLQAQHEELRQTNEELEEQSSLLEEQKNSLNNQNINLEKTQKEVEQKAQLLETASRYKSEFLANMSHELRTPLNSILLLSQHLANNNENSMTEKQVECAATVHKSGSELLNLINEILDLAKVESGKMILELDDCYIEDITAGMTRNFQAIADNKNVAFILKIAENMPPSIHTDCQRISQVIKNLLSNAFKFTDKGSVTLAVDRVDDELPIRFVVSDSGIGISKDNLKSIFQAFQQEDGSTSRKYGGTGLGLSISKELAKLLGGTLNATSVQGDGAVFTLSVPEQITVSPQQAPTEPKAQNNTIQKNTPEPQHSLQDKPYLPDDRKETDNNSRSILIIEDDQTFAKILRDIARERGFKALVAESGETGLQMTEEYSPDGIILDMGLPGIDGKHVLSRLKNDLKTRHIPVHIVSAADDTSETRHMGAIGYLTKPINMDAINSTFSRIEGVLDRKIKTVLHVEDDNIMRQEVADLIGAQTIKITSAKTGAEAILLQQQHHFDCIIIDLGLPDINGYDLIRKMKKDKDFTTPVIIHTARELTGEEQQQLKVLSESIVVKDAKSMDKLLDESSLFLHRLASDLPEEKKEIIKNFHDREAILENKKILIVDDDMRNVFSLTSILEEKDIITEMAENGKIAVDKLKEHTDIDLILMDIMMPEMDGYEATREIRKLDSDRAEVPIIALTAKAMKGDRAKCIAAGANDYLAKPVDAEKLFSMLRVWLY